MKILLFLLCFIQSTEPSPGQNTEIELSKDHPQKSISYHLEENTHFSIFIKSSTNIIASLYNPQGVLIKKIAAPSFGNKQFLLSHPIEATGNYTLELALHAEEEPETILVTVQRIEKNSDHKEPIETFSKHIQEVTTIDPYDETYKDLNFLDNLIKGKRIVILGEQTHLERETIEAKTRLTKYLFKKHGFKHLFFESSIFSMHKLQQKMDCGEIERSDFSKHIYNPWSHTASIQPLYDVFLNRNHDNKPKLYGFDSQFYNPPSFNHLKSDLINYLKEIKFDQRHKLDQHWPIFESAHKYEYLYNKKPRPNAQEIQDFEHYFDQMITHTQGLKHRTSQDILWLQVIKSIKRNALGLIHPKSIMEAYEAGHNSRTIQMAENFSAIYDLLDQNEKVIIWAATRHIGNHLQTIKDLDGNHPYENKISLGELLHKKYADEIYAIGFIALEGYYGHQSAIPNSNSWYSQIISKKQSLQFEIEEAFDVTGYQYAFLDMSKNQELQNATFVSRPLAHVPMSAPWSKILDGFFFTRNVSLLRTFKQ